MSEKKENTPTVPSQEQEKKDIKIPSQFKKLVESIESMSVREVNELVSILEEKFGVSASAVSVSGTPTEEGDAKDAGSGSVVTVLLDSAGDQKIAVIKVIKEILGVGLKEAKDLVDEAPSVIKEGVSQNELQEIKEKVEAAGGTVGTK